ncbi:MAG: gliding motility-associated C-terminal domain-containing protein, partial [Lewinellaceae bacterium]|nr:gliding motility-associated C-terminal domain-containing protein [Lewinellaceae bacterium]
QRVATSGVCTDTSFATINVNPTPDVSIVPMDTLLCAGEQVQLQATVSDNTTEFEWVAGGETLSCTDCLNPVASPGATTTYTLEAKNEDCPSQASATVQVLGAPTVLLNTQTAICLGESLQLNLAYDENATYQWTASDPDFGVVEDPLLVVTPNETTTYSLTADNGACPPVMVDITIEVVPPPVLTAGISAPVICQGESVTLTAQVENSQPGDTFIWTDANGNEVGTGEQITHSPQSNTDYTITYTSSIGCGTRMETVSVEVLPAPVANPISDTVICLGDAIQLSYGSDPNTIYEWMSTDPGFSDFNNPEPVVSPTATATYSLVAENGVCPAIEASITVEVVGEVTLNVTASDDVICPDDEVVITAEAIGGSSSDIYSWEGSDGTNFTGSTITVSPLGLTEYTLTYQDGAGCQTLVESVTIDVEGELALDGITIDPDTAAIRFIGDQIFLTANYTTELSGPLTFTWTRNDSLIDSGQGLESIGETLLIPGELTYELTITTPNGCIYTASINITVEEPNVVVPNAFTPNGDNVNDFFNIVAQGTPGNLEITEFKVFNRWGQLVYDNENPGVGWDGTFNDKPQPSEVYFYMISVELPDGNPHSKSPFRGDVTLLR